MEQYFKTTKLERKIFKQDEVGLKVKILAEGI